MRETIYTVGYESVQEPFAPTKYKATLYADYGRGRGPEPVIETAYCGDKDRAAVDLANRALQQGFRPSGLPKELGAAVVEAALALCESAEDFLHQRYKIRDEALAVFLAFDDPKTMKVNP